MAYTDGDSLLVRIRIAFGASIAADPATWTWTDVTAWWHVNDDVTIGWGRSSGAEQPETSTLGLTLKNHDGRFTAGHPLSPYWPHVRKWTPISYDINLGDGGGWRNRFSGYVRKWPLTLPGASPLMALAKIEAVGVLGRFARGNPPELSPLRRTITATRPVAYWPGEDGQLASQAGSATAGGSALAVTGTVEFKPVADYVSFTGNTTIYGTTALADLKAGGSLSAQVPAAATAATAGGPWTVHVAALVSAPTLAADMIVCEWTTAGGTYTRWQLRVTTTSRTQVVAYTPAGVATTLIDLGNASGVYASYAVSASVVAGTVTVTMYRGATTAGATFGGTLGGVTLVTVNPTATTSTGDMPAGHIAVWPTATVPIRRESYLDAYGVRVTEALRSWRDEAAVDRMVRVAAEAGVSLATTPPPAAHVDRMGPQKPATLTTLLAECEAVDGGLLHEAGFGLGYLTRSDRYNPPVALTIDAAAGQLGTPFEPVDDDQTLRNRWTVERVDGSSAVAADAESIDLQGEIEASATLNLATDAPVPHHAAWRLRLTTVQEPRYPALSLNVAAHRELAAAWCACRPGSRLQVVNPPPQNVPGVVDQLISGATETFRGRRSWQVTLNVVPTSPWMIGEVGGEQRVAADGSTLAADLAEGGTSLLLSSTVANGPWTENPADMPLDIRVGGERVTATSIERSLVDTFSRTSISGWGGVWGDITSGSTSAATVNGAEGLIAVSGVNVEHHIVTDLGARTQDVRAWIRVPVTPTGAPINAGLLLRYVDPLTYIWADAQVGTDSSITLRLIKRLSGVVTVLGSVATGLTHATTVPLAIRAEVNGGLLRARVWPSNSPDPGIWQATAIDSALPTGTRAGIVARLMTGNTNGTVTVRVDNVSVQQPQLVTLSARGVGGVQRAWPAGTEVDVWQPAIVAL
ncbi:hypothetical protein DER29_4349 [Micromonospora sp. M71_S20]|uniref:hypothetical protein n=1 Tax=Micromonospora sp. M71_S20 TaxID=592872 RepID=UPI000EB5929C|nr:hypothetical protein [Micromonospora sp. M71_S20]RLK13331.1 hypothetical protein DER29_4349 [Micromonospora sp. M71_S20]